LRAILIENDKAGYRASMRDLDEVQLPVGDVLVQVAYSSLNYKDALAITGKGPVVRRFPMVPGIDLAGTVEESDSGQFRPGDRVLLTGWGVGEDYWGGLAEKARPQSEWLTSLPEGLTMRQAMVAGTAGLTAMLCIMALERHQLAPDRGKVLVTGSSGGVGSFAVRLLSKLGYRVIASTRHIKEEDAYLRELGASEVIDAATLSGPGKPLVRERWRGVVDTLGSHALANACAATSYGGAVAACGLAQGIDFPATVAPFILRGVTLAGIDSVMCPRAQRVEAWRRLAETLEGTDFDRIGQEIGLDEAIIAADDLIAGNIRGRLIVRTGSDASDP